MPFARSWKTGVALCERAAARVLTGEAHRSALEQERAECEQFAERPVDLAAASHLDALVDQLLQLAMHGEALRLVRMRVADLLEHGGRNAGDLRNTLDLRGRHLRRDHGRRTGLGLVRLREGDLEAALEVGLGLLVLPPR